MCWIKEWLIMVNVDIHFSLRTCRDKPRPLLSGSLYCESSETARRVCDCSCPLTWWWDGLEKPSESQWRHPPSCPLEFSPKFFLFFPPLPIRPNFAESHTSPRLPLIFIQFLKTQDDIRHVAAVSTASDEAGDNVPEDFPHLVQPHILGELAWREKWGTAASSEEQQRGWRLARLARLAGDKDAKKQTNKIKENLHHPSI